MSLFASQQVLWLLVILVPLLCGFLYLAWRTKQKLIAQFVQSRLLANLTVGVSQARQKLRLMLMVAAVIFLILAMARPQWGFSWGDAKQQGLDIVVAIDTSRSMLAEDLAPNRLTRAKLAALDLMKLAKSDRLGLVAFAGSAFLQCPLTLDEEAFRQSVETLDVGIIPQGGTALTEAIESAQTAFEKGTDNHKILVLFTDGEDHESGAIVAAEKAAKAGLKIFTIGVGTAEGELINVRDEQGQVGFLKDDAGNAVKSRLNETLLQKIATEAGGFYLPLRGAKPMEALYSQGLARLPKSDLTQKLVRQSRERFHWPLGMAILLLILEQFLPHRKRVERSVANGLEQGKMEPVKALAIFFMIFAASALQASPSSALREYEAGNFHTALDEFRKLSQQKTNDLRLSYNAGTAAYRAKQLEDAQKYFNAAAASPDLQLQQQAYYNLGNTLFEAGDQVTESDKKKAAWENSIKSFQNSLKLNPQDADAKNNLDLVKKKLEELKKQEQQQSKNDKDKDKKDQDKEKQDGKDQQKKDDQKDQQNQDSKDKQKSEKPDDKSKEDQARQDKEQQKNSKQQSKEDQPKKDEQKQKGENGKDEKSPEQQEQEQQEAMAMAAGQMTQEQARQFLDMQKQEDKALVFSPPKKPLPPNQRLKDW
ncbi:MAG: VWA domain-containing protein [Verrucomicrobiota bacterium]